VLRRLAGRPEAALFALTLGTYAYFYQGGGWNANSRFALVRSLVEKGRLDINRYHQSTGDLARRGDDYYSDKAPGASFLGVPAYALLSMVHGEKHPGPDFLAVALYTVTLWSISLPAALGVVVLWRLLGSFGLGPRLAALVTLAYALATMAFPFATLYYGHQLAAALLTSSFALVAASRLRNRSPSARRLLLGGLLLGGAVTVEYPTALAAAILGLYAASFVRPWPRLGWLGLGALGPGLLLAAYHTSAFGGPFTVAYSFSTLPDRHMGAYMGIAAVDWSVVRQLLFDDYRGLFFSCPWLLLCLPGALRLLSTPRLRPEGLVCGACALSFLWLNASLVDWHGGWMMGPRYLVTALPFLTLLAAGVALPGLPRRLVVAGTGVAGAAVMLSAFLMLVATAVKPEVPRSYARPYQDYLLPAFFAGELSRNTHPVERVDEPPDGIQRACNLGQLVGLRGLWSLLPLGLFASGAGAWLLGTLRASREASGTG
jgi:hypothetical protein